ncbi:uncharacterized protein A1O9_07804 [Exophiala aquamarina CBS 119918]|uniref:Zn(2)-C6 fungal-type domain-containing protein n=1 Tax=Exophiala aquamarina CBS 119918 TaxID=1182545 RepID=A0A072PAD3_9EURO|nr:uncharacterized protein A1O9_07804 [Exophiala aquamarina CBS 119918]KEF56223.1 hypothetical protein A1O9_07804 [Exophiala aquamarina CBS 119918]
MTDRQTSAHVSYHLHGMSGRKLAKRACDGCKIRKIKCTELAPCDGCIAAGIACTFVKHASTRGPRRPRKSTLDEIRRTQREWEDLGLAEAAPPVPVVHTKLDSESVFAPNKVAALVLQLCVYRLRMYPVWPVIKVERLVASLQKPEPDIEVFALAYAVAAATIAQIRTITSNQPGQVTAEMMEAQCQYAKAQRNKNQPPDLTTVRIPFFLHIYYENLEPGGLQSITHLREAIAIAHMIGLHRESYYVNVQPEEQEIRRRTLWLLFVTERGVSILHKLLVVIKTKIAFPSTNDTDERDVLLAYQRLITMFWSFDQAGVFEHLDSQDFDFSNATPLSEPVQTKALAAMRKQLDEEAGKSSHRMNDIQALDILVTRQWMRIIIWRLSQSHGFFSQGAKSAASSLNEPIFIAREFLQVICQMPETAIESHGPALETKVFEIASSVADAMALGFTGFNQLAQPDPDMAQDALLRLQRLLGRNNGSTGYFESSLRFSPAHPHDDPTLENMEIEKQLQVDGFDFTNVLGPVDSPDTESLADDSSAQVSPSNSTQLQEVFGQQAPNPVWGSNQGPTADLGFVDAQNRFRSWQDINFNTNALESNASILPGQLGDTTGVDVSHTHRSSVYSEPLDVSQLNLWYMK